MRYHEQLFQKCIASIGIKEERAKETSLNDTTNDGFNYESIIIHFNTRDAVILKE